MKKILKIIYYNLPFKLKFWVDKNLFKRIDEVEFVYNQLKNQQGIMIDVGAHHGTSLEKFMNDGWKIHAFEPDPNNREKLIKFINSRSNVIVNNEALSNVGGLELSFYSSDLSTGISGLLKFHESHREVTKVTTATLKDYIKEKGLGKIDFLKIDTEGHDLFVLQGFDWASDLSPDYIICEFEDNKTNLLGYKAKDLYDFLKEKKYQIYISEWEPIIEYGGQHKWKRFAKSIIDLQDNSWGNFIAKKIK